MGNLERTEKAGGAHVEIHDVAGRVVEEWDERGDIENYTSYFYNKDGYREKVIRETSVGEAVDHFFYDEEGRVIQHIDPEGASWRWTYDDFAGIKVAIDPLGNWSRETYDLMGRLVLKEKFDSKGFRLFEEVIYYDYVGNKVAFSSMGYGVNWSYDAMNRVVEEKELHEKITRYEYDICGNIVLKVDPDGTETRSTYTGLNQIKTVRAPGIHYEFCYNADGMPTAIIDHMTGKTLYRHYNLFGEIIHEISSEGLHSHWTYDEVGNCTLFTLPDGSTISYTYDKGHMRSVSRGNYHHVYTAFDENGHVAEEKLAGGIGNLISKRDLLERAVTISSPWATFGQSYGPSGLVTKRINSLLGDLEYEHDALNQLSREGEKVHDFDALGNPRTAKVNKFNQITEKDGILLTYDKRGNPLTRGSTRYTYDALNRLTEIQYEDGRKVEYTYDPLSRLLTKRSSQDTTLKERSLKEGSAQERSAQERSLQETIYYLYDHDTEIGTMNAAREITHLKVVGLGTVGDIGGAVLIETPAGTYIPLHDLRSNIVALISPLTGTLADVYDIDAFGLDTHENPLSPWRFSSKRQEESLIFFGLRFYDPVLQRFFTPDPLGFADGSNLYAYVHSSPLSRLDLFGLYSTGLGFDPLSLTTNSTPDIFYLNGDYQGIPYSMSFDNAHFGSFLENPGNLVEGQIPFERFLDYAITPSFGDEIALGCAINGINNNIERFADFSQNNFNFMPGAPFMGIYNPTTGSILGDVKRATDLTRLSRSGRFFWNSTALFDVFDEIEFGGIVQYCDPTVKVTAHVLETIQKHMAQNRPNGFLGLLAHSGGGSVFNAAFDRMQKPARNWMKDKVFYEGRCPYSPVSILQIRASKNIYSYGDTVTGWVGLLHCLNPFYKISMVSPEVRGLDHDANSPTYQKHSKLHWEEVKGRNHER